MNSDSRKKWSIDEAADTIKAIFFINQTEDDHPIKLRYTDLKQIIEAQGREIYPNMLSDALLSLVNKRQLTFEESGREKFYSLVPLNREQIIQLMAVVDIARIQSGRGTGAIAEPDEGWSYYAVTTSIRNRVRPRLRAEARTFRKKVVEILDEEVDQFLDDLERKVKGRVEKKQLRAGLEALDLLLLSAEEVGKVQSLFLFGEKLIEEFMPGSNQLLESIGGKYVDPDRTLLKKVYGLTEKEYDEAMVVSEDIRTKARAIFEKLAPKDGQRFAERLVSLMVLRSSLCAVVHL